MSANLRLSWIGDHDSLKEFVRDNLILQGTWSSPACKKKLFESEGLTILWLKNKKFLAVNGKDAKEIRSRLIEAMCTSSDFAGVNTSVDMATNTENVVDDNISVNHGEVICFMTFLLQRDKRSQVFNLIVQSAWKTLELNK